MPRRAQPVVWGMLVALLLAAIPGMVFAWRPPGSSALERAKLRWQQYGPQHYEMTLRIQGPGGQAHVLLQVHDNRIDAGTDLVTGRALPRHTLIRYNKWALISGSHERILRLRSAPLTLREQLALLVPALALQLGVSCTTVPQVSFDPQLGFPTMLRTGIPCVDGEYWFIQVESLRPLEPLTNHQ